MTFTTYIIIGLVFGLVIEWIHDNLMKEKQDLENWMRLAYILVWPIALLIFLDGFFKARNNKNKEK